MANCCFTSKNCNGTPKSGKYAKKKKAAPRRKVAAAPTARRSMRSRR